MQLGQLAAAMGAAAAVEPRDTEITLLAYDSRLVQPGALFFAVPGFHVDGHDFIPQAARAGARAAVVRRDRMASLVDATLPLLAVDDTRLALSAAAAEFFGHPGRSMRVIGITGTDGKTTTSYLTSALLEAGGYVTGLMGTVDFKVGPTWRENDTRQTTPEALEVQQLLAEMRDAGVTHAVVESSSHGLELRKLEHCSYDAAIVTNVGADHLELHQTPEAYLAAKGRLFALLDERGAKPGAAYGVVNADDPHSAAHMRGRTRAPVIAYAVERTAEIRAEDLSLDEGGVSFTLVTPHSRQPVRAKLPGRFNVSNMLAAAAVAEAEGVTLPQVAEALARVQGPPGRMERIDTGQPFTVIVDYAHTGPALEKVLRELRPVTPGRITVVFGCAGGRSPERRSGMGGVAAQLADFSVLTNEDPHEEDPQQILAEIAAAMRVAGRREAEDFVRIEDRRAAIHFALEHARPGDLVLLAGKGHERSIIIGRTKTAWHEQQVAREELAALGYRRGQE